MQMPSDFLHTSAGKFDIIYDMTIYHGSQVVVQSPIIRKSGHNKDFGPGFYCTTMEKQAIRWAVRFTGEGKISEFVYTPNSSLRKLTFSAMSEEWLDFIAACRRGIPHDYDIVEGPMANDTIFNYVQDFADGKISRAAFWELAKFKHPTHQISFNTQAALTTIRFSREWTAREDGR